MALTGYERVKRWREKNRVVYNLRRRNARKGLGLVEKEAKVEATVSRVEMPQPENPPPFATKKVGEFRMLVLPEEEKPATEDSRTVRDVVGGIYRNDSGGVISKFAYEKLQRLKEHAKANNFEIDEYSQ